MRRRKPSEDCIGFCQRVGCQKQLFARFMASFELFSRSLMVFVPGQDSGNQAVCVTEIATTQLSVSFQTEWSDAE